MGRVQEKSIDSINIKKVSIFGYVKVGKKILLVKNIEDSLWKTVGGSPRDEEYKDFSDLGKIDFMRRVLERKIYRKSGIMVNAKSIVFVRRIDGFSFVFMMTELDHSSKRIPKAGEGIEDTKLFPVKKVTEMIERGEILENHALALTEILN